MTNYKGFAYLYDLLMENAPYETWAAYIDSILIQHLGINRESRIILDIACGTGNITIPLANMGYDMIGVDISTDMLSQAIAKSTNKQILFLAQDMRELDLYGTVDAAICVCDGMNYILHESELAAVFKRVRMFLNPGGVFIFDMNTNYKFEEILGDKTFAANVEGATYEWDNLYDAKTGINEYRVTFTSDKGEPFEEVHHQRAYSVDAIINLLSSAGFNTIDIYDGYSDSSFREDCVRAVFIAYDRQLI